MTDPAPATETVTAAGDNTSHLPLTQRVEAVMLSVDRPLNAARIAEILGSDGSAPIREAIDELNRFYKENDRSFNIEQVAGGFQVLTLPAFKPILAALHRTREDNKLSPSALETLAIIAYKQPALRTDIEAIRGVASGEMIRSLMEKHLVKIVGRAEEIGRPMLYGTTKTFLEVFGLASLKDLPKAEELTRP